MQKSPKEIAIDILSRRDNSIYEMRMKLKKKEIAQEGIDETIDWLIGKRLLNNKTFAQKRAESIFRTKLVGPRFIYAKLQQAKVASHIIDEALDNLATSAEWDERARKAIEQWKKVHPKHADDKIRQMRFLAARGFDRVDVIS
jgi:regulatory protein